MALASQRDDDIPGNGEPPLGRCPFCGQAAGECDHLVAAIDRSFAEVIGGALFAQSGQVLEMMARLVCVEPETLEQIGAGPALEHVASIVANDIELGESPGEAVAANALPIMAALSYMLQEDGEVLLTESEEGPGEVPSYENLWASAPEAVVERLVERLQELVNEVEK